MRLGGAAAAGVRFAVSPLMEVASALVLLRRPRATNRDRTWVARARHGLTDTPLLAALNDTNGYVPDFLSPEPAAYDPDLMAELHQVATAPSERVRDEFTAAVRGRPANGLPACRLPDRVLSNLDRGERDFCQTVADELHEFWRRAIAPAWPDIRRRLEDDIDDRARLTARSGSAAMWSALHPRVRWHNAVVTIVGPHDVDVRWGSTVILAPSAIINDVAIGVDPCGRRNTFLVYPATVGAPSVGGNPLGAVLGRTRTAILGSLDTARTTHELAALHGLSPATVSYHLTALHRAGLVTRERVGRTVRYRCGTGVRTLLGSAAT
jgi:DNA-binding transcriptional ArsR family regulator